MDLDIAQEVGYLRTTEDIYYHYEEFTSGYRKVLFITGLSGGGKSTLSRKIAQDVNGIAFPLDFFYHMEYFEETAGEPMKEPFFKLVLQFGIENGHVSTRADGTHYFDTSYMKYGVESIAFEFIQWALKNERKLKQPVVIEGIQVSLFPQMHSLIYGNPLVIKNTSTFQSFVRAAKRDTNKPMLAAIFKRLGNDGLEYIGWYKEMTKMINVLIDGYDNFEKNNG